MENQEQTKLQDFLREYGELVKKHNVDFASYPAFIPGENGEFKIVCQSIPVDLDQVRSNKKKGFFGK